MKSARTGWGHKRFWRNLISERDRTFYGYLRRRGVGTGGHDCSSLWVRKKAAALEYSRLFTGVQN